jgi:hypothetical protein
MNHHDADLSDVVVVLEPEMGISFDQAVANLKQQGLSVTDTDVENDVVEGTIETTKVKPLEKLACVKYVRSVFNYTADFPTGDPRNLDKDEDGDADADADADDVDDAGL